ncbi:MAG TPA: glycosyltransferase family 4 protein, partial [Bacteroidota bacterium]|nr:glycosyltransferase family 4 protein [Bacteroidota bacterium]
ASAKNFDVTTMRIGGDFDPVVIWKTRSLMKRKKIETICTNMDKDLRFGGIAAKLAGVRGIVPSREIDYPLKNSLRYKFAYNTLASLLVVNSIATQKTVLQSAPWLDASRTRIIYKGIDLAPFDTLPSSSLHEELNLPVTTRFMTFLGQLDERKGIRYLLDAWKKIHTQFPDTVLLMGGTGPMRPLLESFLREHHLTNRVHLLGFRNDVPDILKQSSMLVLPSLWEGFGYVLVEAMAARIPTIATATSSIPEIVAHKQSGLLVPVKNADALADAMTEILSDDAKARAMGAAGRAIVEQNFTIDVMIGKFEQVFHESVL